MYASAAALRSAQQATDAAKAALQGCGLQATGSDAEQQDTDPLYQEAAGQQRQQYSQQRHLENHQIHQQQQQQQTNSSSLFASQPESEVKPDSLLRLHSAHLQAGANQGASPVAVFTSAATGAGLQELLHQIELKVCSSLASKRRHKQHNAGIFHLPDLLSVCCPERIMLHSE